MQRGDVLYQKYVKLLKDELVPAMGCTEPISLAYCAARARSLLGMMPEKVIVEASGSIVKNVKSVVVPNTGGARGIPVAAAAGIVAGKEDLLLECLSQVTERQIEQIHAFIKNTPIEIRPLNDGYVFDIIVTLEAKNHTACARISEYHTNIVYLKKDGDVLLNKVKPEGDALSDSHDFLNLADIWDFAQHCDLEDVRGLLESQITSNMAIAKEGLAHLYGAGVERAVASAFGDNPYVKAYTYAAAASDARMNGCELPVVINSGSGNQGITSSVPVVVYAEQTGAAREKLLRALVLSNLITLHEKSGVGRLSAYCGAVCAGAAASAAIAYLDGADYPVVSQTVSNALAIVSGIVCDGAKSSCAGKIAAAVHAGMIGYQMARAGTNFCPGEGIVADSVEDTIKNVGRLAKKGMYQTNNEIIELMTEHC